MAKNKPSAQIIAARTAGGPHFEPTFQQHMMDGGHTAGAGAHSGLHSLRTAAGTYPGLTEVARIATDTRVAGIYCADMRLRGGKAPKRSSFFPATMTWAEILTAVTDAWTDSRIYAPQSEVYGGMAAKYGLSWVGLATIAHQRIWIGAMRAGTAQHPIDTAFPAVGNKFF